MPKSPIDFLGIAGAGLILFSFYRTSIGKWTGKSLWFELDNLLGSLALVIYAIDKGAYITIVLNTVYAAVALRGLTSLVERRAEKKFRSMQGKSRRRATAALKSK
jgi:hypothetical protein